MLVSAVQSKVARQWKLLRYRPNSTGPLYEVLLGFVGSVPAEPVLRLAFQKYSTSRIDPGKDDRTFFVAVEISCAGVARCDRNDRHNRSPGPFG